jgi:hypothetical protein
MIRRTRRGNPQLAMITRTLQFGGLTKAELLERLTQQGVELNEAARVLLASDRFTTAPQPQTRQTVELRVRDLDWPQGATLPQVYDSAARRGFGLCPLELGPHFRLQYLDQPEGFIGQPATQHRTPPGAIVEASVILSDDDKFPKGFYLRRINGTLWLRGYWCGLDHVCDPDDRFLFLGPPY